MRNHIAFKFLAILLCAVTLTLSLCCGAATAVLWDNGLFDRSIEDLRQDRRESACQSMADYLVGNYVMKNLSNCSEELLWQIGEMGEVNSYLDGSYAVLFEEGEWYYTLKDSAGRTLQSADRVPNAKNSYTLTSSWHYPVQVGVSHLRREDLPTTAPTTYDTEIEKTVPSEVSADTVPEHDYKIELQDADGEEVVYFFRTDKSPEYTVTLYMTDEAFQVYNAADWRLMETAQRYRYYLIGGIILGLLLFAVGIVYLCCAAGRKPGGDEVKPQAFNCLPLDLYAVIDVFLMSWLGALVNYAVYRLDGSSMEDNYLLPALIAATSVFAGCLLFVAFLYACAAQIKTGGGYWWRHSVIFWCCRKIAAVIKWLFRLCRRVFDWIWKTAPKVLKWGFVQVRNIFRWVKKCLIGLWGLLARICRRIGSVCNRAYSLLPLTWQWLLVGAAMILSVLIAQTITGAVLMSLVVCTVLILYGAHCFGTLLESAERMSKGDLDTKVDERYLSGSFRDFARKLNDLAGVAVIAAQKQMKSERMKAELVTNVSHDIKTPLTSIINYVDLLQKAQSQEEAEQYLEVLSRQSQRLKKLIEDLMEMSKATTGNLSVDIQSMNAVETVNQALGEFADKLEASNLTLVCSLPEKNVYMLADGRLSWRVMSNLLSNAVKYALPGTRLYVDVVELEGKVLISLKNISREQLNVNADELLERFVRGDTSRNTEGSGLGLNIAKSLMELQHGQLQLLVDGDLFKVTLVFPTDRG